MSGYYGSARVASVGGIATGEIPGVTSVTPTPLYSTNAQGTTSLNERYMKTTTASAKFKYAPFDALYFEGGYQWQEAIRSRDSTSKFVVPSAFLVLLHSMQRLCLIVMGKRCKYPMMCKELHQS